MTPSNQEKRDRLDEIDKELEEIKVRALSIEQYEDEEQRNRSIGNMSLSTSERREALEREKRRLLIELEG